MWIAEKFQSNPEIAGSPRNSFRASLIDVYKRQDYGTLSVRALLVDIETGKEVAASIYEYPHGVMDCLLYTSRCV